MLPGITPIFAGRGFGFPVIAGATANNTGATQVTSHACALPAGVVAGDMLIAMVGVQTGSVTITDPTGWKKFFDLEQIGATTGIRFLGYYRIATGGETSMTFTTSAVRMSSRVFYRITGHKGAPEATTSKGQNNSAKPPILAPSWGAKKTLFIAATSIRSGTLATISSSPTGYTDLLQTVSSASNNTWDIRIGAAISNSMAASENPSAYGLSVTTQDWVAATIAIQPA